MAISPFAVSTASASNLLSSDSSRSSLSEVVAKRITLIDPRCWWLTPTKGLAGRTTYEVWSSTPQARSMHLLHKNGQSPGLYCWRTRSARIESSAPGRKLTSRLVLGPVDRIADLLLNLYRTKPTCQSANERTGLPEGNEVGLQTCLQTSRPACLQGCLRALLQVCRFAGKHWLTDAEKGRGS
jgi:hypothetical protein